MVAIHYPIPEELHRAAKVCAAARGVTLRAFVTEAIEVACQEAYAEPNGLPLKPRRRK